MIDERVTAPRDPAPGPLAWLRNRKGLAIQALGIAVVAALWGTYLSRAWDQVAVQSWRLDYATASAALVGWFAYFLALAGGWVLLVRWLGSPLGLLAGMRVWTLSMPARYVPGNVWHIAGRVYLGRRLGVGAETLLGASALEQPLTVLGALLVGTLALPESGDAVTRLAALAPVALLGLVAIHPRVLPALVCLVGRLLRREVSLPRLGYRETLLALGWYLLANLAGGVAFWLTALSLGGPGLAELPRLVGVYGLAYAAGYLALVTPAGIGVREAAIVALLGTVGPAGSASFGIAASLLARAGSALGELLAVLALGGFRGERATTPAGKAAG